MKQRTCIAAVLVLSVACGAGPSVASREARSSSDVASYPLGAKVLEHIRELSSDRYQGRAPGTLGEQLTLGYLERELDALHLERPFGADGFLQSVPLIGITSSSSVALTRGASRLPLRAFEDLVVVSRRSVPHVDVRDSELVFVGYGVRAPEFSWDDFKGVDLHGKTLVMLSNDPHIGGNADPANAFGAGAMTYYGRWTYKYEIGAELGADGVFIIHEEGPSGYPWGVVQGWSRENPVLGTDTAPRLPFEGWLSSGAADALVRAAGLDLESLRKAASKRDFRPIPLGASVSVEVNNVLRPVESHNVVGIVRGSEKDLQEESVLYSAHWDHLGMTVPVEGEDGISNGAIDNASGVAELIEIARLLKQWPTPPRRSFVFLFPTAEEAGLLGARYYASHPALPLRTTLADINLDMMNVWGRTRSIISVAHGTTTLDGLLETAARDQGRGVKPDPEPEKGYFFRTDAFELARAGVPSLSFLRPGADYVGRPAGYDREKAAAFIAHDYHRVTDEIHADWDMAGAAGDVELLAALGGRLDRATTRPQWNPAAAAAKGGGIHADPR